MTRLRINSSITGADVRILEMAKTDKWLGDKIVCSSNLVGNNAIKDYFERLRPEKFTLSRAKMELDKLMRMGLLSNDVVMSHSIYRLTEEGQALINVFRDSGA